MESSEIRLEMSDNISDSLERNRVINSAWYSVFMDNIHEFKVKPDKFHRSTICQSLEILFSLRSLIQVMVNPSWSGN